ncbi:MAG: nucleotidyltransferase domain-containing protein [Candidatus Omnitrophota bacterium]
MDIVRIFKSKTRAAIFRLYYTNPDAEYYLRELEGILSIPVSMIRKELLCLQENGIFISRKRGNLTFFALNKTYPLFDEFKSIVLKTVGAVGLLKQALSKVKGIKAAFIYGSFARNQERAGSDIDLLIVGKVDEDVLLKGINAAEKLLKREINYTIFSREEFLKKKKAKDAFIKELLASQKIFLVGEVNEV